MKRGCFGPLTVALIDILTRVREECEGGPICEKLTCKQLAGMTGKSPAAVQEALSRLRSRGSPLTAYVRDGREQNGGHRVPAEDRPKTTTASALGSRSLLERAWSGSDFADFAA